MNRKQPNNKRKHKINDDIKSFEVRLIVTGAAPEVMGTKEALRIADEEGKDLILINENQDPPIAKIEDYGKYLYNIEKMLKEQKKNSIKSELKEIKLSCNISDHDLEIKARKGKEFLLDND